MHEICYCGRVGEVEERMPVIDGDGNEALECRECGHLDHLSWIPAERRDGLFEKARRAADEHKVSAA